MGALSFARRFVAAPNEADADVEIGVLDGPQVFPGITPASREQAIEALSRRVDALREEILLGDDESLAGETDEAGPAAD